MPNPLHPAIVHFPIAMAFLVPLLIVVFAFMLKKNKMAPTAWLIIIGLQFILTASGYISLETGETEETPVGKVLSKQLIHAHEEASEVFVGMTVLALALSVAVYFMRKELQFRLHMGIFIISLLGGFLAYRTAALGGELVYKHGATQAYGTTSGQPQGILPTPAMNTSESANPQNESLKADENDYGTSDEAIEADDEDSKQED